MQLLVATTNQGKQREIRELLADDRVTLFFPNQLPRVTSLEVAETGDTFEKNALLKAQAFAEATGMLTMSEDSGLEVAALDGFPGIKSARWLSGSDPLDRVQGILDKMVDKTDRRAQFQTVVCLYDPKTKTAAYFHGIVRGTVSTERRGDQGFDYDVIFIPEGYEQTFAELGTTVKNMMSGRATAVKLLKEFILI